MSRRMQEEIIIIILEYSSISCARRFITRPWNMSLFTARRPPESNPRGDSVLPYRRQHCGRHSTPLE